MSFKNSTGTALRELVESKGDYGAEAVVVEALSTGKLRPEDFSILEIWEACERNPDGSVRSVHEAVASGAFPKITGALINSRVVPAYESVKMISDQLVTVIPSNLKLETITGITEAETPEEVVENEEYKSSSVGEKWFTIRNKKYGRRIDVTMEMIRFDQTGQVLLRAQRIGIKAAQYKEKLIVETVLDINTQSYYPSGVASSFYTAANKNLSASSAFNEAGVEKVEILAARQKDDSLTAVSTADDFIYIDENNVKVLIPKNLSLEAWQLANSTLTPEGAENAWNYFKGKFTPLTSPYITKQSATTWYWGTFAEDFLLTEVYPLTVTVRRPGGEDDFKRDVKHSSKVSMFFGCGATDFRHSYRCTA